MTRALQSTQQIAVTLSVNVVTHCDSDTRLMFMPLLTLTPILFLVWTAALWLNRQWYTVSTLTADFREAFNFTCTVFTIGFKSLAYGLGGISL